MDVTVIYADYDSVPAKIMATLTIEIGEKLDDGLVFQSSSVAGAWKVHEFAREAPSTTVENDRRFLVVLAETAYNFSQAASGFFESLYELSIYHANHKTETNQAWEQMAQDLETLEEDR